MNCVGLDHAFHLLHHVDSSQLPELEVSQALKARKVRKNKG